jgi:hypothetical protein
MPRRQGPTKENGQRDNYRSRRRRKRTGVIREKSKARRNGAKEG